MFYSKFALGIVALGLSATPSLAQSTYGTLSFGLGYNDVDDDTSSEGTSVGVIFDGFVGKQFSNGFFLEGETRLQTADRRPATNDSLTGGAMIALRGGRNFGNYDVGAFIGYVEANTDEGTSDRHFIGIAGNYRVNNQLSFNGLIGYLDGTGGTDDDGEDAMSEFTHVALGVNYQVNSRFGLNATAAYGEGIMDDDVPRDELARVQEISIGGTYQFANPNLSAYANLTYADLYQGGTEDDTAIEKRIDIGFTWAFGNKATPRTRTRAKLPRYSAWLATAGGVLE